MCATERGGRGNKEWRWRRERKRTQPSPIPTWHRARLPDAAEEAERRGRSRVMLALGSASSDAPALMGVGQHRTTDKRGSSVLCCDQYNRGTTSDSE